MSGGVFICYRREDSQGSTGRIYDRLSKRLGRASVFLDVDSIAPGLDFVEALSQRVRSCDALVAVIGRDWLSSADTAGRRRLDDPQDWVRIEIEAALDRGIRIIPVLVDGARMPRSDELPDSLKKLTRIQKIDVAHTSFDSDVRKLTRALSLVEEELRKRSEAERTEDEERAWRETEANRTGDKRKRLRNEALAKKRVIFPPPSVGSPKPGTRLNDLYEIEKLIAHGGMGEVYRGFNIQTMDIVAIRMFRPELLSDPKVLELFRREASILHTLQHEAIVRYFVFSVDPQLGRAYLAMEFVDGPSLTNKLASGPLSLGDVDVLRSRIGSALEAAHARGIIHRDVSSDNIIFPDGDVRTAKIIDFGIARALQPGERTIIGIAGKCDYASPEQLGLAGGDVTFKSDIYSFGLVLAQALRGRPIDMSGSQVEIIEKRLAVPDLSDIPPSIRPLIRSMLQPLPADRPASMAAVSEWTLPAGSVAPAPRRWFR
jgi:tRNA A-37 threonylcarbamoyl transferase component Bud32